MNNYRTNLHRIVLNVAVFAGLTSVLLAEPAAPLDLEAYLDRAAANAPGLQAGAVRMNAAERDIEALPRWYLPDLYVEAGYGGAANTDENRSGPLGRVIGAWTLWDGGRADAEREVAGERAEVARIEAELLDLGLRKTLALAYYRAARLEELQRLRADEIEEYRRLERSLGPRRRIGTAGASDVLNVRVRADALRDEREANAATLLALRRSLLVLAGLEAANDAKDELLPVVPPLSESFAPLADLTHNHDDTFVEQHPRYRVQLARLRYLKAQQNYVERDLYGGTLSFEAYGGYGPDIDAIDPARPEAGAGIRFRFPLYSSRDRSARLAAGQGRIEALRLEAEQELRKLHAELLEHHAAIERDRTSVRKFEALIAQSRRALNLGYDEFRRGQKAPADMIGAIETLYELRRERLNTLMRLRLALFEEYTLLKNTQKTEVKETGL